MNIPILCNIFRDRSLHCFRYSEVFIKSYIYFRVLLLLTLVNDFIPLHMLFNLF